MKLDKNWVLQIVISLLFNILGCWTLHKGKPDTTRDNGDIEADDYLERQQKLTEWHKKENLRKEKVGKIEIEWFLIVLQIIVCIIQIFLACCDCKCKRTLALLGCFITALLSCYTENYTWVNMDKLFDKVELFDENGYPGYLALELLFELLQAIPSFIQIGKYCVQIKEACCPTNSDYRYQKVKFKMEV